ncbi:MAG: Ig-like domain-containing protein [Verrucomicrobiota bacterium]
MNHFIPKLLTVSLLAVPLANAQVSYTGGVYFQDFNTLPGTTNNTVNSAWTDNATLAGWYASKPTFGVTDGTIGGTAAAFQATNVANNIGLFSFGTAGNADRALGSRATSQVAGNDPVVYGLRLVNNTTQTLTSFTVTYTGEQWYKSGDATADTLLVDYQLGAAGISSGTWTAAAGGTFTSPINTATAATVAGNTAANRSGIATKVTGVSWAPGAELWVRFRDANDSGDEQGLGVDDFSFIADNESGLFLNGSSSYVTMGYASTTPASLNLNTSSFTVECRFMRTGTGATASTGTGGPTAIPLVAKGVGEADADPRDANYFLGIDSTTGRLCADFEQKNATNNGTAYAAGQNFPVYGSTVLQNGMFYHVAATYDTATAIWKLYVNGVAETTTQTLPTFVGVVPNDLNTQGFGIGAAINSTGARTGFFHGFIDEVRVWNHARSAADISANKDQEIAAATGLLARYGFEEGTGTTTAGTIASGAAAPVGTLTGSPLPIWVNSKVLIPNVLPTVALTAPVDGGSVVFPAAINLSATANDTDGSVIKVEFYNGAAKIGEDLTGPSYDYSWNGTSVGSYTLTAVVTDNAGDRITSAPISVSVTPNPNQPPVATLTGPADNATGLGSSTTLSLGLADPEGDAQTVTFYGRKTTPLTPGPNFSIGTLPDTQFYAEGATTTDPTKTGRAPTFGAQTQWYLDNRNSAVMPNLAFISHQGDIVENGDSLPGQWPIADEAMKRIENPSTSFLPYGIPYGVTPGNHDFGTGGGTGTTTLYNQYFGIPRFAGRNYYGDGYSGNNLSSYQLFSASGLDFISISLEYNSGAKSTYQAQLDWADALLKAHPNRRALVTTHWMVNTGNPATFSTQGQNIYDDLKDNPNLFLLLGGHVAGEGRRSDTFEGRTVHSVLQDYQGRTNGGDGWLRYFVFSPANNTITAKTYRVSNPLNPAPGTFETDADSEFVLPYNQQSAVTAWIPLGTVNVPANGTTADLSWTGLEKDSNYEWYATSFDGINTTASVSRRFTTAAASAPVVTLTDPATGSTVALPATIEITADATDADGTIARVEFYNGGTKLGEDSSVPYSFTWNGAISGTYSLTATAVDNENRATLSNVVSITVTNPANIAPSVAITAPANGSSVVANTAVTLTSTAADTDGIITKVEFYLAATKLGEDLTAPFSFNWAGGPVGSFTFTAVATDNDGGVTTSSPINIFATPAGPFLNGYAQGFDADLGTAGTVPPSAWTIWNGTPSSANGTWTDAIPTFGGANTVANSVGTMVLSTAALTVSSAPTANANNGYNAAAPGDTANRMLATAPTSTNGVALQLELTNTGVEAITKLSMAYEIRRFLAVTTANELPGYWLFYSQDDGASWSNASAFNTSISTGGTVQVPNTVGVTNVPATVISLASPWYVGSTLRFRWVDDNAVATSPDQIVGLDNVSILATETIPVIGMAPTVALTAPASNASFYNLPPSPISIEADAGDSDGAITKVEFYRGTTKLGEDTTEPYAYAWNGAPVGSHSLSARATDSDGNVVSSAARVITVLLTPGSSGPMLRSPYLNQANHNSIVVRWRSTNSNIGRVRYGLTPGNLNLTTDEAGAQTNHVIRLTGLTPATRYYYSVGSAVDTLTPETVDTTSVRTAAFTIPAPTAADYTFRTSPVPGTAPAEGTRIWVVGDCGRGSATQAAGRDAYYNWMGSRTPDLNLQMGDNAYNAGTDAEYQTGYFQMYPTIFRKMTQWSTLGNHDANNGNTDPTQNWPYFDMFTFPTAAECGGTASGTEHYYSFDYGNVHFISLDSQTTLASSSPTAAQTLWLQNDLASTTQPWKIVFFHHPPYSKGSHNSDTESQMVTMRTVYGPILEAGGVDLVLTGHSHNYERSVLLDGHYGISTTITPAMKLDAGNGSTTGFTTAFTTAGDSGKIRNAANNFTATATVNGAVIPPDGAYKKPLLGPLDHTGTIYNTAGMSGQADGGNIDHTAMYISYDTVGTVNLDINGNTLVATYVQADGNTPDNYTIIKSGEADRDRDGVSDAYEIANGLSRFNSGDAQASAGDGDGISAFLEFAFGLNPNATDGGSIVADVPNGLLSQRGQPTLWYQSTTTGTDFRALYIRRKNAVDAGLIYTPQFSGDMLTWTDSVVTPTVIADGGEVELVSVRYPFFVAGKKARFFRIAVSSGN